MTKEQEIINFIDGMKEVFDEPIKFVFYRGYCYWFAYMLAGRFNGEIWFNPHIVHFAVKINDSLYDIYGKVEPGICPINGEEDYSAEAWQNWTLYQALYQETVSDIVDSCIKKNNKELTP